MIAFNPLKAVEGFVLFAFLLGMVAGAAACRGYQWIDERIDVRLKWEEVSSP